MMAQWSTAIQMDECIGTHAGAVRPRREASEKGGRWANKTRRTSVIAVTATERDRDEIDHRDHRR
jgi:hypothetical protein